MKSILSRLTVKSRITLMLIAVSLLASAVIGILSWSTAHKALTTSISQNLQSVRVAKSFAIESYFDLIYTHTRTLAESQMTVNAMRQFNEGFKLGLNRSIDTEKAKALDDYYDETFMPRLQSLTNTTPVSVLYKPQSTISRYYQHHYISGNPFPVGEKDGMIESPSDTTIYNRFHKFYHPLFSNLLKEHDYYDIFLIDIKGLNIVYSVFKETDFATSLREGPYRESNLGILANEISENPERGKVSIEDYRSYSPSYGAPAAFVGSAIFDGNEAIGILAIQLPVDQINTFMTSGESWSEYGLGDTGEAYLVGSDYLMRSVSRYFLDDKEQYFENLKAYGASDRTINNIQSYGTMILNQPVTTDVVELALDDQTDTLSTRNYFGLPVLSSYAPLNIPGLDWIVVAEIEENEAFLLINDLQRTILIWSVVLILFVAFLAMAISRFFVRPIERLATGAKTLAKNPNSEKIDLNSDDEFGELARRFNFMADQLSERENEARQNRDESIRLLHNIVPAAVAERINEGSEVCDQLHQVSIASIKIDGFSAWSAQIGVTDSFQQLSIVTNMVRDLAAKNDVDIISLNGGRILAATGLTVTRLDHAKRIIDFCLAIAKVVHSKNLELKANFSFRAGIDSGSVVSGVIGTETINYSIWGAPVDSAANLLGLANNFSDSIFITKGVHDRVSSFYQTSSLDHISTEETGSLFGIEITSARTEQTSAQRESSSSEAL